MKIYIIRECDSYGKSKIVATATSKKKATKWLTALNLENSAYNRTTEEFDYNILPLKKNNITLYKFFAIQSSNYYVVDEYDAI